MTDFRKYALLVGNTRGATGASLDIESYHNFLRSCVGGAWNKGEIETLFNPTCQSLTEKLDFCKSLDLDYFLFIFSGHGGINRESGETIMELRLGEDISESCLDCIASRQLSIMDCCRDAGSEEEEVQANRRLIKEANYYNRTMIRAVYEKALRDASKFHSRIYACRKGECSIGEYSSGGVFSQGFIEMANILATTSDSELVYLDDCFFRTATVTQTEKQHPDAKLPKTPRQLPWAVNKEHFALYENITGGFINPIF